MKAHIIICFVALGLALAYCLVQSRRSKKPIAFDVQLVLTYILLPILGNLLIIISGDRIVSLVGYYVYFIGMDCLILGVLRFTAHYCRMAYEGTKTRAVANIVVFLDIIQLVVSLLTHHAFGMEPIVVNGGVYYALVPLAGQYVHRIIVYGILCVILGIFIYKTFTAPRIYIERYAVMLVAVIVVSIWETYYILSGTPIDHSMIGFGVFGLFVYYFALRYKPFRLLDRMLAQAVSEMGEAALFFDKDGTTIYANAEAQGLLCEDGDQADDLDAASDKLRQIIGEDILELNRSWSKEASVPLGAIPERSRPEALEGRISGEPAASTAFWEVSNIVVNEDNGRQAGSFLTIRDKTAAERQLRHERYLAHHDPLTGIYNATRLYERAEAAMAANPDVPYSVVAVNVREFKLVNDVFSKETGDRILQLIAEELARRATPNELYGRITGDKFGFVLPTSELDVDGIEQRMGGDGFLSQEIGYSIVIHLGIYDAIDRDVPITVMFDRAFMALSTIKNDYRRHVARYTAEMRDQAIWNQRLATEFDEAISSGQIRPYFQPMVDSSGKVEGAEVLVRWQHPEEGLLAPDRFIPFFEETGLIAQLDRYMWECACKTLKKWQDAGVDLFLSVNISPKDFYFMDVYQVVTELVGKHGVEPSRLRLEITENVMSHDLEKRLRIVEGLRGAGFLVEMDDFGSGYSSLNMLKDIPVDVLKIDMMFLYKTEDAKRAKTILQMTINLSEQLDMLSVTEGVETEEQLSMLKEMGCKMFQGYYFAKPMPAEEFEEAYCPAA